MLDEEFIRAAVDAKEHWKAKERLQGRLSRQQFNPALFEAYGFVLLAMNDTLEAGKYLFLSGVRKPEYLSAINLYLDRYSRTSIQNIHHTFPKAAQAAAYRDYPTVVINDLAQRGYTPRAVHKHLKNPRKKATLRENLTAYFFLAVFVALVGGFVVSGFRGIAWVWSSLTS